MSQPSEIFLRDYQPPTFSVKNVSLHFTLHPTATKVRSTLHIDNSGETVFLNGEKITPDSIKLNGEELSNNSYKLDDKGLTLTSPPGSFVLETEVTINPEANTALEGLYLSSGNFCTQCEAQGFRKITYYPDRPDVMSVFNVRIEANKNDFPVLLSNGNPGSTGDIDETTHFAEWNDPHPKPAYLFALVAGKLEHIQKDYTTAEGRKVDLRIYVEPENIDKCDHAMTSLIKSMKWDEEVYGRSYDLDVYNIVAVNDFNMGAMENKGLNVFNSKYVLARQDTATDNDYLGIESVIAHEYFHNWTGNRITCRDWFQLSLKEGLTVFRDQEFSADLNDRSVCRIGDVRGLRARQFEEDAGPMAHPVRPASFIEINNFYTTTIYEKGAEVVRMQANLLGKETYRKATDLYFERHDGQAVTTDDFVQCMADASGKKLDQFKHWYDYAGTPEISAAGTYDEAAQTYTLTLGQKVPDTPGQTDKPAFLIPVHVGLVGQNGDLNTSYKGVESTNHSLELRHQQQSFVFEKVLEKPVPSLLRSFSAPVKLSCDYSESDLLHLLAKDSDGFNRWDAAQEAHRGAILTENQSNDYLYALETIARDTTISDSLKAELLTLPGLTYLADKQVVVDYETLDRKRNAAKLAIAQALSEDLRKIANSAKSKSFSLTPAAIGKRRLRNLAISYLCATEDEEALLVARKHFDTATNMTDQLAALSILGETVSSHRQETLDAFEKQWKSDPLIMDKWFSVQAMSSRNNVLDDVKKLMGHEAFSMKNPNKVRSLIGAFARGNLLRFHAKDGSGYHFTAEQCIALDKLNPQIASRLTLAFAQWKKFDEPTQHQMKAALQSIIDAKPSSDVFEIASKSLK